MAVKFQSIVHSDSHSIIPLTSIAYFGVADIGEGVLSVHLHSGAVFIFNYKFDRDAMETMYHQFPELGEASANAPASSNWQ